MDLFPALRPKLIDPMRRSHSILVSCSVSAILRALSLSLSLSLYLYLSIFIVDLNAESIMLADSAHANARPAYSAFATSFAELERRTEETAPLLARQLLFPRWISIALKVLVAVDARVACL
jgi:hypothetical protein